MKHLLTAALIATALASPVQADGEVIRGQQAYQMLLYGNVISSTGMVVAEDWVIHFAPPTNNNFDYARHHAATAL